MINFMVTCPFLYGFIMFGLGAGCAIVLAAVLVTDEQYSKGFTAGREAGRMKPFGDD